MPLFSHIRLILISALLVALTACSSIQLGYNQGDTLIRWWIDDYVGLNDVQSDFVSAALKRQFSWHRAEQLPLIQNSLVKLKRKLGKPLTVPEALESYQDIRKHLMVALEHMSKDAATLALSLNIDQLKVMEKKYAKTNEKFRKQYLNGSASQRLEGRTEKVIENTENIFGSISKDQASQIAKLVESYPVDMDAVYKERIRRQRDLITLLRKIITEKPTPEVTETLLLKYIQTFEYGYTPEQKEFETNRLDSSLKLTVAITQIMTESQRKNAQDKVGDWIDDIKVLITNR
jgi:hypothetical protein